MYIYKITDKTNNKVYIGQTVRDPEVRLHEHLNDSTSNDYFHQAIRKHGKENFLMEVIDTASSIEELNQKEMYWISFYNSFAKDTSSNGYNTTCGGTDNPMYNDSVRDKHHEKMRSEEVRRKISTTMKRKMSDGELFTSSHRKNLSNSMKGNQHFKGHKRTPEAIAATSRALHKKVHCVNEQEEVVMTFDAVIDAAKWWFDNGYKQARNISDYHLLSDMIKSSATKGRYILGLRWIYD